MPRPRPACRLARSSRAARTGRAARAAHVQALEPRRLMSVVVQSENVALPAEPYFYPFANFLYFAAATPADGVELWQNDGAAGETHTAGADAVPGPGSTNPGDVALLRQSGSSYDGIYFTGDDPAAPGSRALYHRDGNTGILSKVATFQSIEQVLSWNRQIVFVADGGDGAGRELWRTDGTPAGTVRLTDIAPGPADAGISGLTLLFNKAIFSADDGVHGAEPWVTDGTAAGTNMVIDLNPGPAGSAPRDFLGEHFNATTAEYGSELWVTQGTLATTRLVADAVPGPGSSGLTPALTSGVDTLYSFTRGDVPLELYRTDGTTGVTTLVKRITDAPAGERPVRAGSFLDSNGSRTSEFLFTAADPATGLEPWRSDGTAVGTYLLKDINPGPGGSLDPDEPIAQLVGGRAVFAASDGSGVPVLWTTIGTAAGTAPATGPGGQLAYNPTNLSAAWRNAFFAAGASAAPEAPRTLWMAAQERILPQPVPTVSGRVYQDLDGDGVNKANDGAVAGATVYADLDGNGRVDPDEPFVRSGAAGNYVLPLEAGTYTIRVVLPAGYTRVGADGEVVTLAAGGFKEIYVAATVDSGAAITSFRDADGDGVRDAGFDEPVQQGRTIWVDADGDGQFDGDETSAVTDYDGAARFALPPGDYTFREQLPLGWGGTGAGGSAATTLTVNAGATASGFIGSRPLPASGTIHALVYEDVNASRTRGAGDRPLAGRVVYADLDRDGALDEGEPSATSGADGSVRLVVPTGDGQTYDLRQVVPAGWTQTQPAFNTGGYLNVAVPANGNAGPFLFGSADVAPATISGEVYDDPNANGVRDEGEVLVLNALVYLDLDNDGVKGDGDAATVVTAGQFAFANVTPGTYTVRLVAPAGQVQTDPGRDDAGRALGRVVTVAAGQGVGGVRFGTVASNQVGTISGDVFDDRNGNGDRENAELAPPSLVVYLDTDNDAVLDAGERRFVTQAGSVFTFAGLAPGAYVVRAVAPTGYRQTAPEGGASNVTVSAGQTVSGVRFGFAPPGTAGAISGHVFNDANGNGVRDAGEAGRAGTVFLDANNDGQRQSSEPLINVGTFNGGFYSFTGVAPGTYVVRALPVTDYTLTRPDAGAYAITLGPESLSGGNDFGFIQTSRLGRIYGLVFDDANANGRLDTGETGPAGRTVWLDADDDGVLDAGERTATQGADGYLFSALRPGTYTLRVAVPPGMRQTFPAGGARRVVTVALGQTAGPNNFGLAAGPDTTAPSVAAVVVGGTEWSMLFPSALGYEGPGPAGYPLPPGAPPRTVPWVNADTVSVTFSEDVLVRAGDLRILGANGTPYAVRSFAYDPRTFVATWFLTEPPAADRVRLELATARDGARGITDGAGNALPAADAVRTMNVLAGDANGDGAVNALDLAMIKMRLNRAVGDPAFTAFADLNGDGRINAIDLGLAKQRLNRRLLPAIAIAIVPTSAAALPSLFSTTQVATDREAAGLLE